MGNPGASGANSSSSAQSQRQHVVPGDGDHNVLQRGKTKGEAGNRASAIIPIPLVGSLELPGLNDISCRIKRLCALRIQFFFNILNDPQL